MDTNYTNWTCDQLLTEILRRNLAHHINPTTFPDEQDRGMRLISRLESDDILLRRHPEILKYGWQPETEATTAEISI